MLHTYLAPRACNPSPFCPSSAPGSPLSSSLAPPPVGCPWEGYQGCWAVVVSETQLSCLNTNCSFDPQHSQPAPSSHLPGLHMQGEQDNGCLQAPAGGGSLPWAVPVSSLQGSCQRRRGVQSWAQKSFPKTFQSLCFARGATCWPLRELPLHKLQCI